ncbi:MAG TPA: single-stranded DNA-binding protein [Saprospiraceae bacterium]|jgi:single-strand DNA-binding protein|nr:MAG: single-stranded DNA-binding protein [Candidatus Parvibacillus calidus]MBX2936934.1 single-stranded DNA-binding protein [Saprospiraceae bacterium]MBK7739775.1 single-stranded DNA-binding protein [Candidatus Parvibacillus calidus]MBX7178797.1 single-stranded DNA-binding protein [Saprospiraceae bacterium]MCB0591922.1 single-stranded DNA-binding protein [Saprospiraceae bacterium]
MNTLRNHVGLTGNLGKAPEIRTFEGGRKMARISLVTNERYTNNDGKVVETATWHNLIAWGRPAEIAEKYLTKGREITVSGKLVNRSYIDKNGNKKYVTEIEVNDFHIFGRTSNSVG